MDTFEARHQMRMLAQNALELLQALADGQARIPQVLTDLRGMEDEARSLLTDAGYPGESVWRTLGIARRLVADGEFSDEVSRMNTVEGLASAVELLDSLSQTPGAREASFRIVG